MRIQTSLLPLIAALVLLASCQSAAPAPVPVHPRLEENPTAVDLLFLTGEYRGIVPGTDMGRVKAKLPDAKGVSTGAANAGLVTTSDGMAFLTEMSGTRVQMMWMEFFGTPRVPASELASADGRIRKGATEADVVAYLAAHGLPLLLTDYSVADNPDAPQVREYYVDMARAWAVLREGRLMKIMVGERHSYGSGRKGAVLVGVDGGE